MIPAFPPFWLLVIPSVLFMIVSGILSPIIFNLCVISWNDHHQSSVRTTSPNLDLEITQSSHRTASPTSMPMALPRTSTPLSRVPLRSSSLVTSLSPAPMTSGQTPTAAQTARSWISTSPLLMHNSTPVRPTANLRPPRAARSGTLPGSVPTTTVERPPSRNTSVWSQVGTSWASSTIAPALILASTPTFVRIYPTRLTFCSVTDKYLD